MKMSSPNMLWKKESNRSDALYVDICASGPKGIGINLPSAENQYTLEVNDIFRTNITTSTLNKSDAVAQEKCTIGNSLYGNDKFSDAMEMYNESLCFAEPKSTHISLAYANRSSCFLKLKKYNECLKDIQLAIEHGYPVDLMPKLEERKSECLKCIETDGDGQTSAFVPKLSFEPDEKYPYLANVVSFERDKRGEYSAVAKEDIGVGKTIAVEKAFTTCLNMMYGSKCTICLKSGTNLIPCAKCTIAMFCSDECLHSSTHEYECGVNFTISVDNMENVRGILKAINIFTDADELINFVEKIRTDESIEPPADLVDAKLSYREFLKSPSNPEMSSNFFGVSEVYPVYKVLFGIPKVSAMFNTEHKRRFLMHLIGQHAIITAYNTVSTIIVKPDNEFRRSESVDKNKRIHTMTTVIRKYFGHSCAPNVQRITVNDMFVFYTIRPIKAGEPLRISLCTFWLEPAKRQEILDDYKISCKCERCNNPTAPAELQCLQLSSDPDYMFIREKISNLGEGDLKDVNNKCILFLTKYGSNWSKEVGDVISAFTAVTSMQWLGGFEDWPETYSPPDN